MINKVEARKYNLKTIENYKTIIGLVAQFAHAILLLVDSTNYIEEKLLPTFSNTRKRLLFRNITHAPDAYGIDYYIKDFSSILFICLF